MCMEVGGWVRVLSHSFECWHVNMNVNGLVDFTRLKFTLNCTLLVHLHVPVFVIHSQEDSTEFAPLQTKF